MELENGHPVNVTLRVRHWPEPPKFSSKGKLAAPEHMAVIQRKLLENERAVVAQKEVEKPASRETAPCIAMQWGQDGEQQDEVSG